MKFSATAVALATSSTLVSAFTKGEGFISKATIKGGHNSTGPLVDHVFLIDPDVLRKSNSTCKDMLTSAFQRSSLPEENVKTLWTEGTCGAEVTIGEHCQLSLGSMVEVSQVEEKVDVQTYLTKTGAPWGLQRISNNAGASGSPQGQNFTYSFDDANLGKGVDIYVVDTGVRVSHAVFTGRATEGFSFTGSAADGDGHGTHVAGTAGGAKFGVAQGANVIAVKVLGDDGSGSSSDTISGMDWIITQHNKRKAEPGFIGSVMSMSWGLQGTARTVDQVILQAIDAGIHVSVAAGNDGADACLSTPSHNGGANSAVVTVGSVNIQNKVSTFSNIGECVDIYAPGEQILSAWNTGDNVINFLSGTSMACPHTSGVMAYLMAQDPAQLGQNPAALKAKLLETARKNQFTGNTGGSANLLLSNGVDGDINTTTRRLIKNYVVPDSGKGELSPALGGPTSWAKHLVDNLGKRWDLHSSEAQLRY